MKFTITKDEKNTDTILFGVLLFDTGKKIHLDEGECKEYEAKLLLAKAEEKLAGDVATDGLIFTCPECNSNRLECCENGPYNSEVLNIDDEGDFDYGKIDASGDVDRFQCLNCGYVLEAEGGEGFAAYTITEHNEVVEWIKENCQQ